MDKGTSALGAKAMSDIKDNSDRREDVIKVGFECFDDLTDEEKEMASDNGCGKEWARYIRVLHKDHVILLESDAMEPEDARFSRDLSWIAKIINQAYEFGLSDAAREANPMTNPLDIAIGERT